MASPSAIDLFGEKHREYLLAINMVWVAYLRESDRLRITFRCDVRQLPPNWLKSLAIELFHDVHQVQQRVSDLVWTDLEGSHLILTCERPQVLLPDQETAKLGMIVPIGDVLLLAGNGAYEHILYNESSMHVFSHLTEDFRTTRPERLPG
jgi:hypothetical protein